MTPEKIGKYAVTGVLGEGAMGVVYQGFDPVIRRAVAIKTIRGGLLASDDSSGISASARFRNEAQAVGRMAHPNIVAIHEYGEEDGAAYIAMEYVDGRSLSQILRETPRLPEVDVVAILDQLLAALACAHRHGVWHRDIKPANLLVTASGQVKVTDFGIARIEASALTLVTSTIGTPGYMAPEQYTGQRIDHRIDLFASGALLYRLLTGVPAFTGGSEAVMYAVLNHDPLPPTQVPGSACAPAYDAIVAKALARNPEERWPTAEAFREALLACARALPEDAAASTVIASPRRVTAPSPAPIGPGTHPSSSSPYTPSPLPTGWDAATLGRIERALAGVMGPMARVLVRRAARRCRDEPALVEALVHELRDDAERNAFRQRLESGTGTRPTRTTPPTSAPTASPAVAGSLPVSEQAVVFARAVLTARIGPIASVLVRRAAAVARDHQHFLDLLTADTEDPAQRQRLRAELTPR